MNWNLLLLKLSTRTNHIIVGVIYRHPTMGLTDFNCNYLSKLLENISNKNQLSFLETLMLISRIRMSIHLFLLTIKNLKNCSESL